MLRIRCRDIKEQPAAPEQQRRRRHTASLAIAAAAVPRKPPKNKGTPILSTLFRTELL
jgi:hypothetical protein